MWGALIKGKARRREYSTTQMFLDDFALLRANAEQYNGDSHEISNMAREYEQLVCKLIA